MPSSPDTFSVSVTGISEMKPLAGGGFHIEHREGAQSLTAKFSVPYDAKKAEFADGEYSADAVVSYLMSCVSGNVAAASVAEDEGGNVLSRASYMVAVSELSFSYGGDAVSVTLKGRCL